MALHIKQPVLLVIFHCHFFCFGFMITSSRTASTGSEKGRAKAARWAYSMHVSKS